MKLKFNNIKLKGHRSFYLRDGWINKGLNNVDAFNIDHSVDELGVGSTMVNAIRYYLITTDLVKKERKGRRVFIRLTENFGKKIKKYDKYLENPNTVWLLHYKFVSNAEMSTTFSIFFNEFEYDDFTKEEIIKFVENYIEKEIPGEKFSSKSIKSDVNCLINNYNITYNRKNKTPEDNLISPFVDLGLIKKINRESETYYKKNKPNINKLSELVIMYVILDMIGNKKYISIEKLYSGVNSPKKVFNLDRFMLNQYIDKLESEGYIDVNRTAGLNQIYINNRDKIKLIDKLYMN